MTKRRVNGKTPAPVELDGLGLPIAFATEALEIVLGAGRNVLPDGDGDKGLQGLVVITRGDHLTFASNMPADRLMHSLAAISRSAEKEVLKARLAMLEAESETRNTE